MNIGVIGLGFMGSTHVKALAHIAEGTLVAVADPKPRRLQGDLSDVQGNIGGPGQTLDFSTVHKFTTAEELLADPAVEAVDVCLPTDLHAPLAIAALEAGKHVLLEKPMALTGDQCSGILAAKRDSGRVLMVAQVIRFWPEYAKAREIFAEGRLGELRSAVFHRQCAAPSWSPWLRNPARSGGGVFDLLIHDVDFCQQLLGVPQSVMAWGLQGPAPEVDWVSARLEYSHQAPVTISGGWHESPEYPFVMDFTITGDAGALHYHSSAGGLLLLREGGAEEKPALSTIDPYEAQLRYFLSCAAANRPPEACRAEDSASAVRTMRAIQESRRLGGMRIEL